MAFGAVLPGSSSDVSLCSSPSAHTRFRHRFCFPCSTAIWRPVARILRRLISTLSSCFSCRHLLLSPHHESAVHCPFPSDQSSPPHMALQLLPYSICPASPSSRFLPGQRRPRSAVSSASPFILSFLCFSASAWTALCPCDIARPSEGPSFQLSPVCSLAFWPCFSPTSPRLGVHHRRLSYEGRSAAVYPRPFTLLWLSSRCAAIVNTANVASPSQRTAFLDSTSTLWRATSAFPLPVC